MYNIQKAVSRLDYAPKVDEIEITDFQKGLGVFTPKPDKPVYFTALKEVLKRAGYKLASADITVAGTLARDEKGWIIVSGTSGQRLRLEGPDVDSALSGLDVGAKVEITGDWKTVCSDNSACESISPTIQKVQAATYQRPGPAFGTYAKAKYTIGPPAPSYNPPHPANKPAPLPPLAPIRVTSPGLTVYKGGAVTPRLYLIQQSIGTLEVTRQILDVSVSYTPSPTVQLEIEVPFSRTHYDNGITSGSGFGLGNITSWVKYRFFRTVETYGDRQAALRVGLELPTGKKTAPGRARINAPEFVRQQLTPINGGFSPHFDIAFSQAGGRVIFGGNAEVIVRTERDGFRMGHEQRVNTDLEYVLPRDPHKPGGELFMILETTFVHRGAGRLNGQTVSGTRSTEYFLAPGLQYAAHPRFVVEGSYQFPVVLNTGPLTLRNDRNILLGIRFLF